MHGRRRGFELMNFLLCLRLDGGADDEHAKTYTDRVRSHGALLSRFRSRSPDAASNAAKSNNPGISDGSRASGCQEPGRADRRAERVSLNVLCSGLSAAFDGRLCRIQWPMETWEDHMRFRYLLAAALVLAVPVIDAAIAQQRVKRTITNKEWEQPFPGFKIVGNMYYVGTYDLGCYLIDTGAGLILVNSGAPGSYPLMKANIEALGFKTADIKVITATHGHWDHVGDLAAFQKDAPASKTYMSERDAPVVEPAARLASRRPR